MSEETVEAQTISELTAHVKDLEDRVVALERLLLCDRLAALESRRLPLPSF